ncbi:sugar ABC transporter ATP-binding protein [Lysinimonas soli]|uniref:Sugar ABC transporter ATP-binding protein n=1 Tax=Lysinimonas soli TaxID=1074233 RepID=A0ABW0NTS1_9MICO
MSAPVLELRGVGKSYGAVSVLRDVDLTLDAGSCLGLVGENGAGKSTLLSIVSGKTPATSGHLKVHGMERTFRSPREARAAGIQIIPQELAYLPDLSVAENLMLSNWPRHRFWTTQRDMRRDSAEALRRLELDIDVRRTMLDLSLAERQLIEIAKALMGNAELVILDEPTASLHAQESAMLLGHLHRLKSEGVALIYVSHHLNETFDIADEIAVLRNGNLEDLSPIASTTPAQTVQRMLGPEHLVEERARSSISVLGAPILLRGWSSDGTPRLEQCDLELRAGEVLGVFGLVGSGAETVARGLGGHLGRRIAGTVTAGPRSFPVPRRPRSARRQGIAYVPAERKVDGLALNQTVVENLTVMVLGRFVAGPFIRARSQRRVGVETMARADVRARGLDQEVGELSGGNQQKILLAGRLLAEPDILVLHEPTRGVDVGSRAQIHLQLEDYARAGHAVLLVTSDLQEAVDATDRLLIMRDGRIVSELTADRKTTAQALSIASGSSE